MIRFHAGRLLLGAGAALNIASVLLPWADGSNHYNKLSYDYEYFVSCAVDGAVVDGLRLLAEGVGCISPAVLGVAVLLGALLPRGRANALVSSTLHIALFLMLAAVGGILFGYDFGNEGADRRLLLAASAGAVLFVVLAVVEFRLARKSVKRGGASGDAVHVVPLTLFLLIGGALMIALRGSDTWPYIPFPLISAGSAVSLVGVWLRRPEGTARLQSRSRESSSDIPFAT